MSNRITDIVADRAGEHRPDLTSDDIAKIVARAEAVVVASPYLDRDDRAQIRRIVDEYQP